MTKTQSLVRDIRQKRREITRLQDDLGNLLDHLLVLEARAKNLGRPTFTPAEVRARLGLGTARKTAAR